MKPGEHPDFYRIAPPAGTSRESTIRLDRDGRFWHDGEIVEHRALALALAKWIARHPDDSRLILTNGYDWTYFAADDAPYFVEALRVEDGGARVILRLFDESEELLDPKTLRVGRDEVVYARVKGGAFEARFTRHAQTELAEILVEADPPAVAVGGARYPIAPRETP